MKKVTLIICVFILILTAYFCMDNKEHYIVQFIHNNTLETVIFSNEIDLSNFVIELENDSIKYFISVH